MLNINFSLFSSKGEIHFQILDACSLFRMKYNVSSVEIRYMYFSHDDNFKWNKFYITYFNWSYKEKKTQLNILNVLKYE